MDGAYYRQRLISPVGFRETGENFRQLITGERPGWTARLQLVYHPHVPASHASLWLYHGDEMYGSIQLPPGLPFEWYEEQFDTIESVADFSAKERAIRNRQSI